MTNATIAERWAADDEQWCEICQDDDDPVVRGEQMPLTIPTPDFPFRVCADCAAEWDRMVDEDEWQETLVRDASRRADDGGTQ